MTAIVEPKTKPQADRNETPAAAAPRTEVERPVVLAARGLRKAFGGQVVLDGVDLELREGEVILLRGDNGSGKTTLINILTGNLEPDAGTIHYLADGSPREFRFPRRWWQELNPFDHFTPESTAREGIGRMWQDVRLFNSQSLRDNIAVAEPRHLGENPIRAIFTAGRCRQQEAEIARKANEMLARLGLAGRETSSGDKISLGQSKRVAIARAVAAGARILFLDEPLAGLDHQGIQGVLSLLTYVAGENAITLVIVEHVFNQLHLRDLVTSDWFLSNGKITTEQLTARTTDENLKTASPEWLKALRGDDTEIVDEPLARGARLTRLRSSKQAHANQAVALELRDLIVNRGSRPVIGFDDNRNVSGLNFNLMQGEVALLQAPNGWGKTTLLRAIGGTLPIHRGTVILQGNDVTRSLAWQRYAAGLRVLQARDNRFQSLAVHEVTSLARTPKAAEHIADIANKRCASLSGGEHQLLALVTSGLLDPDARVVLLDEPLSAFDGTAIAKAVRLVRCAAHASILIVLPAFSEPRI